MIYTLLNRLIRETGQPDHLRHRSRSRRPGARRQRLPGGHVQRGLPAGLAGPRRPGPRWSASSPRPAGSPATSACRHPGSIHEGGELGYALVHAAGAAFDHPDLHRRLRHRRRRGRDRAAGGVVEDPAFLNARRDGAVLPILHLNGYKISGPTRPRAGAGRRGRRRCSASQGWDPVVVAGDDPGAGVPRPVRRVRPTPTRGSGTSRPSARAGGAADGHARWPAIILRTPKGWTGPGRGRRRPGRGHLPRPPGAAVGAFGRTRPTWPGWRSGCGPTGRRAVRRRRPAGAGAELRLRPQGDLRMSASPYANGGQLLTRRCRCPRWSATRWTSRRRARCRTRRPGRSGELLRDIYAATTTEDGGGTFRLFCPDETASNRLDAVFEVTDRCLQATSAADRRPPVARRPGHGGAVRAPLPGLARGLPALRAARHVRDLRGVRDGARRRC